jgi:hypothetical protein
VLKDGTTSTINATVNAQLLNAVGMPYPDALQLAAEVTALDAAYRLLAEDARTALGLWQAGSTLRAIARALRPL